MSHPSSSEIERRLIHVLAAMAKRVLEAEEPWSGASVGACGRPVEEGVDRTVPPQEEQAGSEQDEENHDRE
jgi:hypothetical protein